MGKVGRYRIQAVADMTGIPAATLRAWERRYGVPAPARTDASYRLYSEGDVELVRKLRDGSDPPANPGPSKRSPAVQELEDQLCRGLGTRVRLKTGRGKAGKIEITYHNLDELDRLLEVLLP